MNSSKALHCFASEKPLFKISLEFLFDKVD